MTYEQAIDFLRQEAGRGMELGLLRMKDFLHDLQEPQKKYPVIHIAGTNGKGSVSAYLAGMLFCHGMKVGRYSSPPVFYREEIIERYTKKNTEMISREMVIACVEEMKPVMERWKREKKELPTTFEMETALAFLAFSKWNCDLVLLETGLGGAKDATNIIDSPLASVITPISYDHCHILGNTLKEIAKEKAGIVKEGCPVVSDSQMPEVEDVLKMRAGQTKSPIVFRKEKPVLLEQSIEGTTFSYQEEHYTIRMPGNHQVANAALALETLSHLPKKFQPSTEEKKCGLKRAKLRGRMEIWRREPLILFDGAHNPDGIMKMRETIEKLLPGKRIYGIMGVYKDKNVAEMIAGCKGLFSEIQTISTRGERMLSATDLKKEWEKQNFFSVECASCVREAVEYFQKKLKPADVLVIFGSLSFFRELYEEATKEWQSPEKYAIIGVDDREKE